MRWFYSSCVRCCMMYGIETLPMIAQHPAKLLRVEMRMIRMTCGVSLRDKLTSVVLRERMGVEAIGVVVKRNRLRWFGHVERKDDCDWVKGCTVLEVEGPKPRKCGWKL